ncbi:MAG: hypothetical protein A2729_01130 [Candidatus Buchananbacteria bacterium RIFCSPHIGHO2_01_FULL_39_14]|uniref:MGS-like domain-containing protein n=2 Tax=Candidatus Buchananiibacteriota TaxID=1817903 RepID=A0A1G1YU66_9BACT|nr:MAG: hypothetical protein A2729_01130 [Candidatus Buchananbacteria bacterium RIFCSPHIGHO2_01_FULL_39_14]OGY55908.1 MAG: hypothetical protein A2912_02890 [Candidatus Buchananbacteria bacterium RIFCSPLOWO2_01_FULL_40_23b]
MEERKKFALISVYHKEGIVDFAKALLAMGFELLASSGTCRHLREAGLEVKDVADMLLESFVIQAQRGGITFSEEPQDIPLMMAQMREHGMDASAMLGHRVVTLSREVAAALLARYLEADLEELVNRGIPWIDLICCDFYPARDAIAKIDATIDSVNEMTDIGGPTMVRAAAKGSRIVICDPADHELVINLLQAEGDVNKETRQQLRAKAFATTGVYDLDLARFYGQGEYDGVFGKRVLTLGKGETDAQSPAALYSSRQITYPLAWKNFCIISGSPSYVNSADGERCRQIICRGAEAFRRTFRQIPNIAVACKHGNPCGLAISWNYPVKAIHNTLLGDPIAVMGGEIMTNFAITDEVGQMLLAVPEEDHPRVRRKNWGADVIFAPEFSESSVMLLGKREKRKLLVNEALFDPQMVPGKRMIRVFDTEEFLIQGLPDYVFTLDNLDELVGPAPVQDDIIDMIIAWLAAWQSDSNAATVAKDGTLCGLGCGDQDRIWCCQEAIAKAERAGHDLNGAKFGSDGFFPYARRKGDDQPLEGPELFAQAGCNGGVVSADGQNLVEVKAFFREAKMSVAFVPAKHRGFMFHA